MDDDLPDPLTRLAKRLGALEQRVYQLEHPSESPAPLPQFETQRPQEKESPPLLAGGAFPVFGKAMLGIAGAYLLRAVAESGTLPTIAVAVLAIGYALMWLAWAARVPRQDWLASVTYATTSALILAPMLWELTLRFKVLTAPVSACVLAAFVAIATALAWKLNLAPVFWVANVTGIAVALALSIATYQLTPFLATLLFMAVVCEFAVEQKHELSVRPLVALSADAAMCTFLFVYSGPQASRADYPTLPVAELLAPPLALFLIYGSGAVFKTVVLRAEISAFEVLQATVAFVLAASGLLYFVPLGGVPLLGALCLVMSVTCYAASLLAFRGSSERRNDLVFGAWGVLLVVVGSLLSLPPLGRAALLGTAAIAATIIGHRIGRKALQVHGLAFLVSGAFCSGLLAYDFRSLAGTLPGAPSFSVSIVSLCAVLHYLLRQDREPEPWTMQLANLLSASLALLSSLSLLVDGLMALVALGFIPGTHHVAFIRTFSLCAAALLLAYSGGHWHRVELARLGYAALGLLAAKLLFEDLRHGNLAFVAASLFLFALTLIAVPRIARLGQRR